MNISIITAKKKKLSNQVSSDYSDEAAAAIRFYFHYSSHVSDKQETELPLWLIGQGYKEPGVSPAIAARFL
jgi:hypothetical protein